MGCVIVRLHLARELQRDYDTWVAAGLYFDNNTDSGTHSCDYIYSDPFISATTLNLITYTFDSGEGEWVLIPGLSYKCSKPQEQRYVLLMCS